MPDNGTFHSIEEALEQAQSGNQDALEHVLRSIEKQVYTVSVRMLWHPEDAKDATQEILLRIATHLSTFRGKANFRRGYTGLPAIICSISARAGLKSERLSARSSPKDSKVMSAGRGPS